VSIKDFSFRAMPIHRPATRPKSMEFGKSPIKQCPTDIMQAIFEWSTIEPKGNIGNQSKMALALSQVCRLWRFIALETPTLWYSVILNLNQPRHLLEAYWNEAMRRVKGVPMQVTVVPGRSKIRETLPINFHKVKSLEALNFSFRSVKAPNIIAEMYAVASRFQELVDLEFEVPACPIHVLRVMTSVPILTTSSWRCDSWLAKWPAVTRVELVCPGDVTFSNTLPLPYVKEVLLHSSKTICIRQVVEAFPNVEKFLLMDADVPNNSIRINIPSLITLKISSKVKLLWKSISCPKIRELSIPCGPIPTSFLDFLQSHRSITTLELPAIEGNMLRRIALLAPQLINLQVHGIAVVELCYNWLGAGLTAPAFPFVTQMVIVDTEAQLTLQSFESLVQARCLPSLRPDVLRSVGISRRIQSLGFVTHKSRTPQWLSSDLLKWADLTRRVETNIYYQLKWTGR